jgi:hypothetical protein
MTTYQLQHRFNLEMERNNIHEPVMSILVQDCINYAYQQYITEKYDSLINPVEKFEVTERISRILAPLLYDFNATSFTSITTNSPYGYYCTGPTDLQYIIKEKAVINTTDCDDDALVKTVRIIPIRHSMVDTNTNNPFLKPNDDEIWRLNYSGRKIELILTSGQTLVSYTCRYLKKHTDVSFNPVVPATGEMEIDSSVHEEIVIRAAYMYLGTINKKN